MAKPSSGNHGIRNEAYIGEGSVAYLDQRRSSTNDRVQSLRASLFQDLSGPNTRLLDFGCGTGGILKRLPAASKVGIEIGEAAGEVARDNGAVVLQSIKDVPDASIDVAISFHAIEHVDYPLDVLIEIAG